MEFVGGESWPTQCFNSANGVRWYEHVLRTNDNSVLRVAPNLKVSGKRKRGRSKKTWKKQVEENLKTDTMA